MVLVAQLKALLQGLALFLQSRSFSPHCARFCCKLFKLIVIHSVDLISSEQSRKVFQKAVLYAQNDDVLGERA